MNILISSASTSAKLTIFLAVLIVVLLLEVAAYVGLFIWRKKALKGKSQTTADTSQSAVEPTQDSAQPTQVVEDAPVVESQAAQQQNEQSTVEQPTDAQPVAEQPTATEQAEAVTEQQSAEQPATEQNSEQHTAAETTEAVAEQSAEHGKKDAFAFFAPFALLSAASNVSSLRGAVYALAIICMIGAVGAVVLSAIFAMQISKKKDEPAQEPAQEPIQTPVEPEPEPQPEPVAEEPIPEPQPELVEEVVEPEPEPTPEPIVEEPTPEPAPEEVVATSDDEADGDDDDGDDDDEEEESRIFVETDDGGGYFVILEKTFTARMIQSKKQVKEYYSQVKNALLSHKKVSARMSKPRESFRYGKATIARLAVRGKTLRLYLDLNPLNYADGAYKVVDVSDIATYADTPLLFKITNERRCEYAVELIEDLMIKIDAVTDDKFKEVNYVAQMPFESTDDLVEKGLIVKKLAKGTSLFDSKVVDVLTPSDDEVDVHADVDSDPISDEDGDITDTYERSFTAKLMQADVSVKQFYSQLKNYLLSYAKVNARMTKKREVFRLGKNVVAKMSLRSKTLRLYLALDYGKYKDGKYLIEDASSVKAVEDTPVLYRIADERRCRFAKELIDEMLKTMGADKGKDPSVDYASELPYKTDEELFLQGLIVLKNVAGITDKK